MGGKTQPTLSSMLSAVKEENQYKGGKKAANMSRCTIVRHYQKRVFVQYSYDCFFFLSYTAIPDTGMSKYQ